MEIKYLFYGYSRLAMQQIPIVTTGHRKVKKIKTKEYVYI
jgi:hypothetical protein